MSKHKTYDPNDEECKCFPVQFEDFRRWTNVDKVSKESLAKVEGYKVKHDKDTNIFKKAFTLYKCFYHYSYKRHKSPLCGIKPNDSCTQEQRQLILQHPKPIATSATAAAKNNKKPKPTSLSSSSSSSHNRELAPGNQKIVENDFNEIMEVLKQTERLNPSNYEFPVSIDDFQKFSNCKCVVENLLNSRPHHSMEGVVLKNDNLVQKFYNSYYLNPESRGILGILIKPCPKRLKAKLSDFALERLDQQQSESQDDTTSRQSSAAKEDVSMEAPHNEDSAPADSDAVSKVVSPHESSGQSADDPFNQILKILTSMESFNPDKFDFPVSLADFRNLTNCEERAEDFLSDAKRRRSLTNISKDEIIEKFYYCFYAFCERRDILQIIPKHRSEKLPINATTISEATQEDCGREVDESALPEEKSSNNITVISATQQKKVIPFVTSLMLKPCLQEYLSSHPSASNENFREMALQRINASIIGIFDVDIEKHNTLDYLLRITKGTSHIMIKILLNLTFEEFRENVRIYSDPSMELISSSKFYEFCYKFVIVSKRIWPRKVYISLESLFPLLCRHGLNYERLDLSMISPKILHWSDLIKYTNYDECARHYYFQRTGDVFDDVLSDLNVERQNYYDACYSQEKWVWKIPCIVDVNLKHLIMQNSPSEESEGHDSKEGERQNVHDHGKSSDVLLGDKSENTKTSNYSVTSSKEPQKNKALKPGTSSNQNLVNPLHRFNLNGGLQLTHKFRPLAFKKIDKKADKENLDCNENNYEYGNRIDEIELDAGNVCGEEDFALNPESQSQNSNTVLNALNVDNTILNCTDLQQLLNDNSKQQQQRQSGGIGARSKSGTISKNFIELKEKKVRRQTVYCAIKRLKYFQCVTKDNIKEHRLQTDSIGERYLEFEIDCGNRNIILYKFNDLKVILTQICKDPDVYSRVNCLLNNLNEYHYDKFKTISQFNGDKEEMVVDLPELDDHNLHKEVLTTFFNSLPDFCHLTLIFSAWLSNDANSKANKAGEEREANEDDDDDEDSDCLNVENVKIESGNRYNPARNPSKSRSANLIENIQPCILEKMKALKIKERQT